MCLRFSNALVQKRCKTISQVTAENSWVARMQKNCCQSKGIGVIKTLHSWSEFKIYKGFYLRNNQILPLFYTPIVDSWSGLYDEFHECVDVFYEWWSWSVSFKKIIFMQEDSRLLKGEGLRTPWFSKYFNWPFKYFWCAGKRLNNKNHNIVIA